MNILAISIGWGVLRVIVDITKKEGGGEKGERGECGNKVYLFWFVIRGGGHGRGNCLALLVWLPLFFKPFFIPVSAVEL